MIPVSRSIVPIHCPEPFVPIPLFRSLHPDSFISTPPFQSLYPDPSILIPPSQTLLAGLDAKVILCISPYDYP